MNTPASPSCRSYCASEMSPKVCVTLIGNCNPGRRLSSTMMVHGGHWGAPSVMAAFAGFVHDRESTANDERNDDNDAYYAAIRRASSPVRLALWVTDLV